jgi:hypothetical protein
MVDANIYLLKYKYNDRPMFPAKALVGANTYMGNSNCAMLMCKTAVLVQKDKCFNDAIFSG